MTEPLLRLAAVLGLALLGLLLFYSLRPVVRHRRRRRHLREDALKLLYKGRVRGDTLTVAAVTAALDQPPAEIGRTLVELRAAALVSGPDDDLQLTEAGDVAARHVVRAHRLWERYLADLTGYGAADWHEKAEDQEHTLSDDEVAALEARLGYPTHDPHGDPIPNADGTLVYHGGRPLTEMAPGAALRIVHLEDEPPARFDQILAAGLAAGQDVTLLAHAADEVTLRIGQETVRLPAPAAANVSVIALPEPVDETLPATRLAQLDLGQSARVAGIDRLCRQTERRRLLDLGLVPGTLVTAVLRSPSGDPVAYDVRGALIALRREQAALIAITEDRE